MKDFLIGLLILSMVSLTVFAYSMMNRIVGLEDIVEDMNEQIVYIEQQIGE